MVNQEISREAIIKYTIAAFIDGVGFLSDEEKHLVNEQTDIIKDFDVDGDDASFIIMELEKHFKISASQEEWGKISRIHEIADLIIRHLDKKK